jgi:hypothetical protein
VVTVTTTVISEFVYSFIVSLKTGITKIKTMRINLFSGAENNKICTPTR